MKVIEEVRQRFEFQVVGYVVMPEHIHMLIGESYDGSVGVIMLALKQRVAGQCRAGGASNNRERAIALHTETMQSFPPTAITARSANPLGLT